MTCSGSGGKPLLLLDVDGPLNPFRLIDRRTEVSPKARDGEEPYVYARHHLYPRGWGDGLPVLLCPEHGDALRDLAAHVTLVWATTWEDEGNSIIAPLIGLPNLPVVYWPEDARGWALYPRHRGSWKTPHILRWVDEFALGADGRPLPWAWVDDDINGHDRAMVREHYSDGRDGGSTVDTLLLRIEPSHGLRRGDFDAILTWAAKASEGLLGRR